MRKLAVQLIGFLLAYVASMAVTPLPAYTIPSSQAETVVEITSPKPNQVISGVVQITGTVYAPNFAFYRLDYATDPPLGEESWISMQAPISQQVRDGVLGAWDTSAVADGRYMIRLQAILSDGAALENQVRVTVINATATPPPTALPTFTSTPEPSTATPGPSPTPLIWQPPTRTPRPTATPGGPTITPTQFALADSPFSPQRLQQAACRGALITLGGFGFLALYGITRRAVRYELRTGWWAIRDFLTERRRQK